MSVAKDFKIGVIKATILSHSVTVFSLFEEFAKSKWYPVQIIKALIPSLSDFICKRFFLISGWTIMGSATFLLLGLFPCSLSSSAWCSDWPLDCFRSCFLTCFFFAYVPNFRRGPPPKYLNMTPCPRPIKQLKYFDSIGFFFSLLSKIIGNPKSNFGTKIKIWNFFVPISKILDKILFHSFGKSLICVIEKKSDDNKTL